MSDSSETAPLEATEIRVAGAGKRAGSEIGWPTSFEIFVFGVSILSVVNIILLLLPMSNAQKEVIRIIDGALCFVFLLDFAIRYRNAPNKRAYVLRGGGWLDLIGSLPYTWLRLARCFRMWRVSIGLRKMGGKGFYRRIIRDRASSALYGALFLAILVFEFCSVWVLNAESKSPEANIKSGSDALWWSYVTVATVGYGDRYPVTNPGRIVGVVLMSVGVGLFGVFTGFLANKFLTPKNSGQEDTQHAVAALQTEIKALERLVAELKSTSTSMHSTNANESEERPRVLTPSSSPIAGVGESDAHS
jgi:voltage-gated potassium channel Kch